MTSLGGWHFLMSEVPLYMLAIVVSIRNRRTFSNSQVATGSYMYMGTSLIRNRPPS